jgi:hypothetical protein
MSCPAPGPPHQAHAGPEPGRLPGTGGRGQMVTGTPMSGPLAALPGCGGPVPAGPGRADISGTWPALLAGCGMGGWASRPSQIR